MTTVGQLEALTQQRVLKLLRDTLHYRYLGNWKDRTGNSSIEEGILTAWLTSQHHSSAIIARALHQLRTAAAIGGARILYDANRDVYSLLRYGVKVQPDVGEHHVTVWLIDWEHAANNDFAVAEEVTVTGPNTKRPDVVLYVNGIALAVLELKRSTVSVAEGIRQNFDSQKKDFIQPFFATVQLLMAGNDTEGLRYGVIETSEKYYLAWKEPSALPNPLDRALTQLCSRERLLELIHDFTVFDAGTKKLCRHNQYFGVRAAQEKISRREGGIIWHTQGSGKSLTMVWLAKWIRENVPQSRVLIITDRTELDAQIEGIFLGIDEQIRRTRSGADLVSVLTRDEEWLICSLVHKFGASDEADYAAFTGQIKSSLPAGFHPVGQLFVFVDECHRTQSGQLHEAMKAMLPGSLFIGFTGTPLLKQDKQTSLEIFGPYIHTYRYDEAVRDGAVLDLRYEARDIDQDLTSPAKVDAWFEVKTKGLTDVAKAQLKQRWGTMQKILSAKSRLEQIVNDICWDMDTRDRLKSGHGNAILVSDSIYQACRLYELLEQTPLKGKCAIVTSYRPAPSDIKGEDAGEGATEKLLQYNIYRRMLATHFGQSEDDASGRVEEFERNVKQRFIKEPGQMKLLIVVDKLLTGFDAPPATYLYIDKHMQDHGLFQAICRVNRLDTPDKEYGYIVDYKDLFKSLEQSIHDYTGEAFSGYDRADVDGLLKDRLAKGRERLEELREAVNALCEPVEPPRDSLAYIRCFCGDTSDPAALKEHEPKRVALYELVPSLLRAYSNLANEMEQAGYTPAEAAAVRSEVEYYERVRKEVKLASGDFVDMKFYEPAMRHLLDTYIRAEEPEKLSAFDDFTLVQLVVDKGVDAVDSLPVGLRANSEAVAEAIENNVRKLIIDEMASNPRYYEKMSELLDGLIQTRKQQAADYKTYLAQLVALTKQIAKPETQSSYPSSMSTPARRALYDNLDQDATLAERVDTAIRDNKKDDWRGNTFKQRELRAAIRKALGASADKTDAIFELAKNQRDY